MNIRAIVIEGQKKGREYGFPTANIALHEQIDPGIYAGRVTLEDKVYDSAIFIGSKRPDVLEAHIFDFDRNLYGKFISVEVLKKIRNDKFFTESDDVAEIIKNDIRIIKEYFVLNS